jgi:hypothetical protein
LADERYGSAGSSDPDTELVSETGVGAPARNPQFGVENVVSGKHDRVTVSTTFRQQSLSTGKQKAKTERRILCSRSESSWYYSIFLCQLEQEH